MNQSIDLFTDKAATLNYDSQGARQRSNIFAGNYTRFSLQFFFKFSYKKIAMGKQDRCAMFGCNNDCLFPEKYTVKFSFRLKSVHKY